MVSCRYSVEGGRSQGLMKIFIEISSLYVAIENLNPVRSGKLYFYPPCILATDWIFTSTFQRAQE